MFSRLPIHSIMPLQMPWSQSSASLIAELCHFLHHLRTRHRYRQREQKRLNSEGLQIPHALLRKHFMDLRKPPICAENKNLQFLLII